MSSSSAENKSTSSKSSSPGPSTPRDEHVAVDNGSATSPRQTAEWVQKVDAMLDKDGRRRPWQGVVRDLEGDKNFMGCKSWKEGEQDWFNVEPKEAGRRDRGGDGGTVTG